MDQARPKLLQLYPRHNAILKALQEKRQTETHERCSESRIVRELIEQASAAVTETDIQKYMPG